jgi:ATP-grasp domain
VSTTDVAGARVLLLIPAQTYRASDFLAAAHRMGLTVVVGSDGALSLGGDPVLHADPRDPEDSAGRLVSQAGPVDAVVAVDTPMLILASAVAARAGLPHNPIEAVMAAADKAAQRHRWAAVKICQPAFRVVPAGTSEQALAAAAAEAGFPCVVKAVSLSGSQGVLRAEDKAGAIAAATRIRSVLAGAGRPASEPLIIEEYVPGPEVSVDGLLNDGSLAVMAVFDKPDTPEGPTFEETLLVTPSRLPQQVLAAVRCHGRAGRAGARAPLRAYPRRTAHRHPPGAAGTRHARTGGPLDRRALRKSAPLHRRGEPGRDRAGSRPGTRTNAAPACPGEAWYGSASCPSWPPRAKYAAATSLNRSARASPPSPTTAGSWPRQVSSKATSGGNGPGGGSCPNASPPSGRHSAVPWTPLNKALL